MDFRLDGKLGLVSGSTAGIGAAIAEGLAREGAPVIINGRTQARVDLTLAEITRQHAKQKIGSGGREGILQRNPAKQPSTALRHDGGSR